VLVMDTRTGALGVYTLGYRSEIAQLKHAGPNERIQIGLLATCKPLDGHWDCQDEPR